uniref:Uncharacterized protein n=1 Tax=Scleropages formosus TaxID=113540 RepID=A0A8C9U936_SCLFO
MFCYIYVVRTWKGEKNNYKTSPPLPQGTSQLESPVRVLTDQACPSPSEQLLSSSLSASTLAQPPSVDGHALGPSAGPTQPTHVLVPPTSPSSPVTRAATSPMSASTQATQGNRPPNANPARPVQTAGSSASGPAQAPGSSASGPAQPAEAPGSSTSQPAQAPGSSTSGPAQLAQDLHPPTSVSTLPKQTPGLPTCSPSLLLQGQELPAYSPQPSQNPPQYSVIPPTSTPTPQSFQSHVVPTPVPQTRPSVLTSFSSPSLPADTPPYEATSAMPQMRISPVPATVPLMSDHQSHSHTSTCPPHGSVGQSSMPLHQFPYPYQDPLYPGFPLNDKEEAVFVPQFSLMRNGEDLPRDKSVLRFFFNLGVKAYTCPMWAPYSYIYPLQQTYCNAYTMQPKVPSGAPCVPPWVSDAPTSTPLLHVNSIPSSTMTVPENYSQVVLGTTGGRAMGQYEHPGVGLALCSEGRPALGYSLQSTMQLQSHTGSMPWPRPATFTGTISSTAPPPPPVQLPPQFLSAATYPAMLPGYSALKLPAGADHTTVAEIGKTMGRPGTDSPAHSVPVPLTEAELSAEGRVSAAASPAQAFVPAERVVLPCEGKTAASNSETTVETSRAEVTLANTRVCTPHKGHVSLGEHSRSDVDLQGAGGVAGGTENILPLAYGAVPQEGAHQSYGAPRELCGEESEVNEVAFRGSRQYYSGPYRGRRSFEDGRGWRGSSRGASRARRDYNYRERRSVEAYPGSFDKGQSGRGRGRAYSQYRGSREVNYT